MKKIFTLTLVFLAMMFGVNAQYLLQEGFETGTLPTGWVTVDADADGYCWEGSANPASYFQAGTDLSGNGHNSSNGFVLSGSYSNVYGVLTPDNWLITPAINLTANADLTFWVCAQDASYAAEHYGVYISTTAGTTPADFTLIYEETIDANGGSRVQGTWKQKTVNLANYTGQTVRIAFRHFNCSDEFVFNLDDVEIFAQPTSPTIAANPSTINFGTALLGNTANATVNVTAYNLTSAITATTAAPFAVSADGTNFGTTASLAAAGGTLYVQYTPTAVGTDNGTVTLSSTGATNVTISLTGAAMECNGTLPYSYSFTSDAANTCWTVIDANNDGYTFEFSTDNGYASIRYNSTLAMDDWLISPIFTLTGAEIGSFDYRAGSTSWFEKFQVFAFGANDTVTLTPVVEAHNTEYQTQYLDFSSLNGNYQIAIHGVSDADQLRLYIANFSILAAGAASITANPTSIDFGTLPTGTSANSTVDVTVLNATDNITVSTTAPYSVSLDNITYAASVTIPTPTAAVFNQTIYVAYNPTVAGSHNGQVTISTTGASETITVTGVGVDCDVITTFPFTETFLSTSTTLPCWQIVDNNNDGNTFYINDEAGQVIYAYDSYNGADEYLISPEMTIGSNFFGHVDYACASANYPEAFSIYVIPANGTIATAVNIVPTVTVTNTSFQTQNFDLAAYANQTIRIAIKAESDADMYLLGFTNFVVQETPDASISVDPTSMSFATISGSTSTAQTANVTAYSLTNDITVSTAAPFEVSANGTSFGTTATIPAASIVNSTIYVRYAPTTGGTQTGNVTLTSGSISATISVSGYALDCSTPITLPYTEDFENEATLDCWIFVDADGDGYNWDPSYLRDLEDEDTGLGYGHNGSYGMVASASWNSSVGALLPDNWLISPEINIPANYTTVGLSWYAKGQDASWAEEHYAVYVSTTGSNISNFTTTLYEGETTGEWEQYSADLAAYAGQNIRIAFRHYNITDKFWLDLDDISIWGSVGIENHDMNISVYPNPANNVLNINANSNINRVEVYNMMGQMVGMYNVNDMNAQISTTALANGVYTVKITTENGMSTKKFTVAR